MWAREPPDLSLGDRAFQLLRREDLGEVEQGPGDGGDADAALGGGLVGGRVMRWESMRGRTSRLGAITSTFALDVSRMPHSAAAERWLRTASGPAASTAAIHAASRESTE
jgi:hypothetical protein